MKTIKGVGGELPHTNGHDVFDGGLVGCWQVSVGFRSGVVEVWEHLGAAASRCSVFNSTSDEPLVSFETLANRK